MGSGTRPVQTQYLKKKNKTKKQDGAMKELELKTDRPNRPIQKSELKTKKQDRLMKELELKMDRHDRPIQKSELDINRLYPPIQSEDRIGIGRSINRTFRPPLITFLYSTPALLQDVPQNSATQPGWRRTHPAG